MKMKNKDGFTLVELMVVIAIIGLLAAIAIPNFISARRVAQETSCINNLRIIDGAIQQYALMAKKGPNDPVTAEDIRQYVGRSEAGNLPKCPSGGTSFEDSYSITTVNARPTCLKQPLTHKLD